MLLPAPPKWHRRPSRRRRKDAAPPAPPAGLLITQVVISGAINTQLIVTFSAPIAWNGVDVPSEFKAFTQDGLMDSCIGVVATGADWIEVEFNAGVDPGAAWELTGAMAGITPEVTWPQAGVVS